MAILDDIQKLNPGAIVSLFELDCTSFGGTLFRFHPGVNELNQDVVFDGNTYVRFPIEVSGFQATSQGTPPRPMVRVSNISGLVTQEMVGLDDFIGAKFTRIKTFVRYLDAVNFQAGNPLADPNAYFSKEVYYVNRKSVESKLIIEWELVSAFDLPNVKLPRRQIIANICPWKYRGSECGYLGVGENAYFDANDNPVLSENQDVCGKKVSSCYARFGPNYYLPFGGFPGAGLLR
jgi:lambda family phage minor tail protein L